MKSKFLLLIAVLLTISFSACQKQDVDKTPESVAVITQAGTAELLMAGTKGVTIAATADWTAVSDSDWLTVSPTSGGKGMQEVTLTFTENTTGAQRKGTITFTSGSYSEQFTLVQSNLTEKK